MKEGVCGREKVGYRDNPSCRESVKLCPMHMFIVFSVILNRDAREAVCSGDCFSSPSNREILASCI